MTDNGANMVALVHNTGRRHYPCFAHTLTLVVKDGVKAVPGMGKVLRKCSVIVSFFHHSTRTIQTFMAVQQQLKVADHWLIQAVDTRWNCVFLCVFLCVSLCAREAL